MSQLSKECIKEIDNSANSLGNLRIRHGFRLGVTEALTNPSIYEKAGLISLEDALRFAEWSQYDCMRINGDWQLGKEYFTTSQLFTIYQEQK